MCFFFKRHILCSKASFSPAKALFKSDKRHAKSDKQRHLQRNTESV